jgi:hypothetical protein
MARRSPVDEKPFRPLDVSILNAVVKHVPTANDSSAPTPTPIGRPEPVSSVRREAEIRIVPNAAPVLERLDQEKRILFTRAETQAIDRLINNLSGRLNAQIKASHIVRALTAILLNAENQLHQRASERGPLRRPPNGDFAALQRFERDIALLLSEAIRDAGNPR